MKFETRHISITNEKKGKLGLFEQKNGKSSEVAPWWVLNECAL